MVARPTTHVPAGPWTHGRTGRRSLRGPRVGHAIALVDLATGATTNLTAIERVSFHNSGLFFWPGDPAKLGFQAIIDGNSHPFRMDRDGRNKRDLTSDSKEFAYGFGASPDGRR